MESDIKRDFKPTGHSAISVLQVSNLRFRFISGEGRMELYVAMLGITRGVVALYRLNAGKNQVYP
jgi:hypothetical protein